MRIVFAGTPAFAATVLEALLGSAHEVVAVYTQPDRPAGRGRGFAPGPVKRLAVSRSIELRQPATLRDADVAPALRTLGPEAVVVAAYGLILPAAVLRVPARGCLNVHASLLPRWRGAAPIQRAILAGDRDTGVSIMQMDEGLDTGPVLARTACPIEPRDTTGALGQRLARIGSTTLLEVLDRIVAGTVTPVAQDETLATHAPRVDKREARIDWTAAAVDIERRVRAFDPWPVAWAEPPRAPGARLRIWSAEVIGDASGVAPGVIVRAGREGVDVATGAGMLRLLEVQPAGGRRMGIADYLAGRPLQAGESFPCAPA